MTQMQEDLKCLNTWLTRIGGSAGEMGGIRRRTHDLLAEHLAAAHRYLLANSHGEYKMCLTEALQSLSCITAKEERDSARSDIRELMRHAYGVGS